MIPRVCVLLVTFVLGFNHGFAQPAINSEARPRAEDGKLPFDYNVHPSSRHFTMNDGLPETAVNWVLQDSRGFLWLATSEGLCKFDGYHFTTYNKRHGSSAFGGKLLNTLWEDGLKRLWIGHEGGLELFDLQTEQFHSVAAGAIRGSVHRFRVRKDGKLWICTDGIYVADPKTLSIKRMTGLPEDTYWDIAEARDGSLWLAGEQGLIYVEAKTGRTVAYRQEQENPKSFSGLVTRSILIDRKDRVWIGGDRGFNLFDPTTGSFAHFLDNNQGPNEVTSLESHPDGRLLVGHGRGLYSFDPKTGKHELIADGTSTSILTDRQGIIWHSSKWGLNQINPKNRKFRIQFRNSEHTGYCMFGMAKDGNNDLWILTLAHGAFRFDPSFSKVLQHIPKRYAAMSADSEGSIWFFSSGELERYDFRSKSVFGGYMPPSASIINAAVYVDSFGNIWIGQGSTVEKYDIRNKTRHQIITRPNLQVNVFLEDQYQNLWMGSATGLLRYSLLSGDLDIFQNEFNDSQSLSGNLVFNMRLDKEGNIWIGTNAGLNRLIKGTERGTPRFLRWQAASSNLASDNVTGIVDGADGTLWLTCGNKISHFNPKDNQFRNYDHADGLDGLQGTTFRINNRGVFGLRTSDGKIAFSTYCKGAVIFHPDSLIDNDYVPPVVITDFLIHSQPVPLANSAGDTLEWESPLAKHVSHTRKVELAYNQNDFTLHFAALNFVNPEKNSYKYKLEPYESQWIETTAANRVARYTNIDPGTYNFRVIGSNNDGLWNQQGASLTIIIAPPWWQTWWAYSLYGVMLLLLFLYWRNFENKRIKLKHRAEHLIELDNLKTRFFTNISHEFRTPITLILGPLKKLYNRAREGEEKEELGTMLRNSERLHRLINQLLDLSKIEAGKMQLHATPVDLVEFLREIAASYESLAIDRKIKYLFYPESETMIAYIDIEKMEKVVHNLLSNAFKFTKSGGEVILNLRAGRDHCLITVKDTGIGIPSDQIDKVFDRFYQVDSSQTRGYEGSGLGMALAKELVDLHHGTISVRSTEGKGSTFTVSLPMDLPTQKRLQAAGNHLGSEGIGEEASYRSERVLLSDIVTPAENGEQATRAPAPSDHPVILIVEDNPDMRAYIRKTLSEQFRIMEAGNGKTGARLAEEILPDLIISDIMMPEMDGYKLCSVIKSNEITSHIPVILLTAKADRESKLSGLETGADDYLSKPFDADELRLIARNRIEERKKMRERFSREITLEPKQITITSLDEKFLIKVLSIIEVHMDDEHFSIEELSREAGFSNMHFYRKIKALSGQTPSQFLRTIRLKRAAEMLGKHSDNVTQIAYSVGFSSLSYFNKCFKEQFGVTPGAFKQARTQGEGHPG